MAIKHSDPDAPLAKEVPSTDYWKLGERAWKEKLGERAWKDFVNSFNVHIL